MNGNSILEGLNADQQDVVKAREGAFLVVAGAGAGKTTALTRRAAALIADGVAPQGILLLTFTRVAAAEMVSRAKKLVPEAVDISGGTFHSIAQRLIKENANVFRLPDRPTVLDPADVTDTFKRIGKSHGRKAGNDDNMPTAKTVANAYSFSVNTGRTIDDVVWDKYEQFGHAMEFIAKCIADYKIFKRERALFDFDDLLLAWDRMLDHKDLGRQIRARFPYVMVDEFQDCNRLNVSIVQKLGGDNPNVMAVGDPAQAIYGFRGTAPGTMFEFIDHWPQTKKIFLNTNYRSTAEVLSVGNAVDRSMRDRFDRVLRAGSNAVDKTPQLVTVADERMEATYIANTVLDNKENGVPLDEQAVLVRSMNAARFVEGEFMARKIPYVVMGGIKLEDAKHIKDFTCLARCAVNQLDEIAWRRILTKAQGIGEGTADKIIKEIMSAPLAMGDPTPVILKKAGAKSQDDLRIIMKAWTILSAGGPPGELLDRALAVLDPLFERINIEDWKGRRRDIESVIAMSAGHDDLASFLTTLSLDYRIDKTPQKTGDMAEKESPITISTVHSAKGLEWDVVYFPSLNHGHMPSYMADTPDEVEEERRVLYVAMTRPRKQLHVSRPTTVGENGYTSQESPFQNVILDYFERVQFGERRQGQSYRLQNGGDHHIDFDW